MATTMKSRRAYRCAISSLIESVVSTIEHEIGEKIALPETLSVNTMTTFHGHFAVAAVMKINDILVLAIRVNIS